ncbi:Retrotransposon-derived protein PEG10 [Smittium culicis]|uniref:Retrotransposon-derived protein PEG10 n=1 Tax=Smittium culicis TaxID=133412 RepID=A0A1R1XBB6_9FUNG|nr:Retrotransposon-derived protein PEG10 [Smittium culicis]
MNIPSASFNQSIDMEQEANFLQPGIPMFSSNDSENSDSCFSGKVKLPDPQKFDGTPQNFKAFTASMQLYFWAKSDVFVNDKDKIIFLGTHLLGAAMIWFTSIVQASDPCLRSYDTFIVQFQRNFSDPNVAINARGMIRKCRQGPRSVAAYAAEFRILGRDSGYDQLALVDQFLRGLNDNVMSYLMVAEIPDRLEDCINSALLVDNLLSNRNVFLRDRPAFKSQNPFINRFQNRSNNHALNPFTKHEAPIPMEIDSIAPRPRGPLSPEEKTRRFENGLCMYCGEPGHIVSKCTKKYTPGKEPAQQ